MLRATEVLAAGAWKGKPADTVQLDYDRRTRRRISLTGSGGLTFLLDLAEAPVLRAGDGIRLEDGRIVAVEAASERLLEITCRDGRALARIAWHLGNRHLATEIAARVIHIRDDHVIADMVRGPGRGGTRRVAPLQPGGRRLRPRRRAGPQPWARSPPSPRARWRSSTLSVGWVERSDDPTQCDVTDRGVGSSLTLDPTYAGNACPPDDLAVAGLSGGGLQLLARARMGGRGRPGEERRHAGGLDRGPAGAWSRAQRRDLPGRDLACSLSGRRGPAGGGGRAGCGLRALGRAAARDAGAGHRLPHGHPGGLAQAGAGGAGRQRAPGGLSGRGRGQRRGARAAAGRDGAGLPAGLRGQPGVGRRAAGPARAERRAARAGAPRAADPAVVAAALACSLDDVGGAAVASDIASMRHETQYTRLFRS